MDDVLDDTSSNNSLAFSPSHPSDSSDNEDWADDPGYLSIGDDNTEGTEETLAGAQYMLGRWMNTDNFWLNSYNQSSRLSVPDLLYYMGQTEDSINQFGILLNHRGKGRTAARSIQDHLTPPLYPPTSEDGILHCITSFAHKEDVTKDEAKELIKALSDTIQYSTHYKERISKQSCLVFGNTSKNNKVWHQSLTYSGVKHCEFVSKSLLRPNRLYNEGKAIQVHQKLHQKTKRLRIAPTLEENIRSQTEAYFESIQGRWQVNDPCKQPGQNGDRDIYTCQGQRFEVFTRNEITYIGCRRSSNIEPWHTAYSIPRSQSQINIEYLRQLCLIGQLRGWSDKCVWAGKMSSTRQTCGYSHPAGVGIGTIQKHKCSVKMDIYFPINQVCFPFVLLLCRGSHTHIPPLPTTLPSWLSERIVLSLKDEPDIATLTPRLLLMNPGIR
ncbi:hypothetical protein LZ31DRAFT_571756, partial [Colletotrichum somersetense]